MYSLTTLHKINAKAAAKPKHENEWSRHCSFHQSKPGIVLHSAKLRSTAFLEAGPKAKRFLVEIQSTNSQVKKDSIIESYFSTVPTGKQKLSQS